jgi:hypothetical protein
MEAAFSAMLADVVKVFAKKRNLQAPNLAFPMPNIFQLDRRERSEIVTLPVLPHNENEISEMIKIIEKIGEIVGLSEDQVKECIVNFKGDFLTVRNERYCFFYPLIVGGQFIASGAPLRSINSATLRPPQAFSTSKSKSSQCCTKHIWAERRRLRP